MSCKAIGKCLNILTNISFFCKKNFFWIFKMINYLCYILKHDSYWLVKVEILRALSRPNYRIIQFGEKIYDDNDISQDNEIFPILDKESFFINSGKYFLSIIN